ncbi:MAG: GIY-YIG nuclease family protein [Desulfurellales bacterium]|nr:MAG: GIY-YIG nuclease family protein [Desulfurellales bacterium]
MNYTEIQSITHVNYKVTGKVTGCVILSPLKLQLTPPFIGCKRNFGWINAITFLKDGDEVMEKIYILRGKETNFFKVGRTSQPVELRIQQLQTGCPFEIEVYATFPTFWPAEMEKFLHSYLVEFRASGEWFAVEPEIIDSVLAMPTGTTEGNGVFSVVESVHGWHIALNEWSQSEDAVLVGSSCVTVDEIEYQCLRIIQSAMGIIAKARQHKAAGRPVLSLPHVQLGE